MSEQVGKGDDADVAKVEKRNIGRVKNNGMLLGELPFKERTMAVCETALRNCGRALSFVPVDIRNIVLCIIAVEQDNEAGAFVPKEVTVQALLFMGDAMRSAQPNSEKNKKGD